jgi:hypothetical protein
VLVATRVEVTDGACVPVAVGSPVAVRVALGSSPCVAVAVGVFGLVVDVRVAVEVGSAIVAV